MQDLGAVRFQQDVLHGEACRAERDCKKNANRATCFPELAPGITKCRALEAGRSSRRVACFLLPERHDVQKHLRDCGALYDLDQPHLAEIRKQPAEHEGTPHHAEHQHDVEKGHDARPRFLRGQIGGQRKAGSLRGMQADTDQKKRDSRADPTGDDLFWRIT